MTSRNLSMASNATLASTMTPTNFLPGENGYNQTITMLYPDGSPFNIIMVDLKTMNEDNIVTGLVTGLQLGLATLMLIVTFLLTQKGKRQSLIFYCNIAALALDPIRSTVSAIWLLSTWNSPYVYFTHDASRITAGNIAASLIGTPFKILEIMAIQISLMTQVRVVLLTSPPFLRCCIIAVLFALTLINTGIEIGLAVINGQQIAKMADPLPIQPGLAQAADISLCIFIGCAMFVFVWKLGYALKNRHSLGLVRFGPLQVIFIMGAQTMIIPTILAILNPFLYIDISALTITITAVTLPLSGLWAAKTLEPPIQIRNANKKQPRRKAFTVKDSCSKDTVSGSTMTGKGSAGSEGELHDMGSFLSCEGGSVGKSFV